MTLAFTSISSPGASRDLFVDLTGVLEKGEIVEQAEVASADPTVLAVTNVTTNTEVIHFEELQIQVGKGVYFTVQTLQKSQATVPLILSFTGDSGTIDKYKIEQPIAAALCE